MRRVVQLAEAVLGAPVTRDLGRSPEKDGEGCLLTLRA
jgi:hypothetical protein